MPVRPCSAPRRSRATISRDGRMDPAQGLPRGRVMAETATERGQSVASAVRAGRRGQLGACDPDRPICRAGRPRQSQCHGAHAQDRLGVARQDFGCTRRGRMADYDLAIIGGGLNGTSLARDAAGRGLRVILFEQGDLGSAASSASPRLIHGDLAALLQWRFLRVRCALAEREVWLTIAPHLVRPAQFAIPVHVDERSPWLLRSSLWLYDRLAPESRLPSSATVDVTHHPIGNALRRPFGTAFEYSDCLIDDSRLVALNAVDAAERGAVIRTGARCVRADRTDVWRLVLIDRGNRRMIAARSLANTTGAWSPIVAETVLRLRPPRTAA